MKAYPFIWLTLWLLIGHVIARLVLHYRQMFQERKDNKRGSKEDE